MLAPAIFGYDLFGEAIKPPSRGPVNDRFIVAPFTILSARDGLWQERKRAWLDIGIQSEVGRAAKSYNTTEWLRAKNNEGNPIGGAIDSGTSIFDPVLCELIYRWFSGDGGQVIDPFAGGSVRGVVASCLGRKYWGCDLRQEQIDANVAQRRLCPNDNLPTYVCGDSLETLANAPLADLLFSCPPYGDLEVYSDDPRDLSNMEWHTFVANYKRIIMRACARLKPDRFACFVVGDFRDSRGFYRNFVGTTIDAFREQGLELYNEAILVTSVGSASMRVTKQFNSGRKLCKTHQNVLIFCKGDWRKAAQSCGEVEV